MKHLLYILLYLNIYTAVFFEFNAQNIQLTIEAETTVPEGLLDSLNIIKSFDNYLSLKNETDSLHFKLEKVGFINNELLSLKKKNDSNYTAIFYLGNRFRSIRIYYSKNDFAKKELLQVSDEITESYFTIPFGVIENSLQLLNTLKTDNGDAFARIHLENIVKKSDNTLNATLVLTKNTKRTIDNIIVKGYEKFPKSYIKHYAGIKKGTIFNKQKIIEQSEALNSLGFTENIKPPDVLFKKDSTTIYLYLKKQKNNLFDGILGFSTNEDSNKLVLNGYLNLELNNNLNYGEQFLLNYKADGNEQQKFRVKVTIPYLLKSPFGIGLELKIFKRDSTFSTTDQQARLMYQITPTSKSYIGYKSYESSNLRNEATENLLVEDYTSKFFIAGASYSKSQNSNLFPIKTELFFESEIGSRKTTNDSESQIRLSTILTHIFNLNFKNSIFLQNSTKLLRSDTFLTNELFRFGGINSIRGFSENSIDASFYTTLNTEYRYQFNQGIYLHSIIDVAYFENQVNKVDHKLYSFGIGAGTETKAGILKFSIANGNAENQDFNFSNTKIHISILSRF